MTVEMQSQHSSDEEVDVTDLILQDIQAGTLAAGSWLKQVDLEQRYNRGRNQVRRALDRLVQKRLVQHVPNRGYHVYEPDGRQASEIAEIRIILETAIAGRIISNATDADQQDLRQLATEFERLVLNGTILQLYEVNLSFHNKLVSMSGNHELTALITEIRHRTSSAPASQWKTRVRIELSAKQHHQMVDAIIEGDVEALRTLLRDHIGQV